MTETIDAGRLEVVWRRAAALREWADRWAAAGFPRYVSGLDFYEDRPRAADLAAPAPEPPKHARDIAENEWLIAVVALTAGGHRGHVGDLAIVFAAPEKVIRAKLRRTMDRDLVDGCACGCRGDVELLEAGAHRVGEVARALVAGGVQLPVPIVRMLGA
jgi:hypothetical protein